MGFILLAQMAERGRSAKEREKHAMTLRAKIPLAARPFDLADVRLLPGPFRDAMERDARYLLSLEPDRLLHRFRLYAGLEPRAPVYGGWEQMGISGHTLGHYLSACARAWRATGDERFRGRVAYIVEELALCQSRHPDGYVGAIPEAERIFREVAAGDIRTRGFDLNGCWVPWYTLHKLFAGLLDAYLLCDEAKARTVAARLGDWAIAVTRKLDDAQWQKMLACEHGGMNEALALLWAVTGETRYGELARRFHHRAVLDPLERRQDRLAGLHGNTQIPKVIGAAALYEQTGEERYRTIAEFFWERVVYHHSYAIGGHSSYEYFGPADHLADRLTPNTAETCNTYNMVKLTGHLFGWDPSVRYADFAERALLNHILASQDPRTGMVCYYVPLEPGALKRYSSPADAFWCCVGTGIENHVRFGESIYYRGDDALYVCQFIASEATWPEKGMTVRQETRFPVRGTTRLRLACERPVETALYLRCPAWSDGNVAVRVNGSRVATGAPGSWAIVRRTWRDGDVVDLSLPMRLRAEPMPDDPKRVALLHGPVVLAGDLGPEDAEAPRIPVLVTGERPVADWLKPVKGETLTFRTADVGRPGDLTLVPFYRMHHRRYTVYWDLFTPAQWARREEEYRAEEARQRDLAARTVDLVRVGEMQPERDHDLQGEKTGAGEHLGRKWRHATDGGWFSFVVTVLPDAPVDLICTYWGSDAGGREWDILVDGTKVAAQTLNNDRPGAFFEMTYPMPEAATRGRNKVTIRFQARPGRTAGGLFGCRVVRRKGP